MFFMNKKKKIRKHLDDKPKEKYTPFDLLLIGYLDGSFVKTLKSIGLNSNHIEVYWDDEVQYIAVESSYRFYMMDLTIYTDEIHIYFTDEEPTEEPEPDACKEQDLLLESTDQLFDLIKEKLAALN